MAQVIRHYPPGGATLAALNLSPAPGDPAGNLLLAGRAIAGARREHPSLRWVVLPELFTCGYSALGSVHRYAEDARPGRSARFFRALARKLGLYVAYGFPERLPGSFPGRGVSDSANLVGPEGVISTYRKRNLVVTTGESLVFVPGEGLPVVQAGGMRVALMICWDLGFPEVAREAAMSGADLILAPAAWREPWGPQYDLSCAARALDSGVYVASANQLGDYPESRFATPGGVYGPDGLRVSRKTGAAEIGDLDPGAPGRWRRFYGNTLFDEREAAGEEALEICS